jgi:hypothetical protein
MIRPRWLAWLLAHARGFFWLPCPICNRGFAGFESGEHDLLAPDFATGRVVCSRTECQEAAIRHNRQLSRENKAAGRMWSPGYLSDKYAHLDEPPA